MDGQALITTMSAVWDRTSAFIGDHLGPVAAIAALTLYVPGVAQHVLQPLTAAAAPPAKLGLSVMSLALSLVALFGQVALIALVLEPAAGSGVAFSRGLARLPATIGVSLVLVIALVVLFVPPLLIAAAGGADFSALSAEAMPNLAPGSALLIVLYFLVLTPLLIWAGARLATVGPVIVAERRGLGAIRRGFSLTRGLAARIVGVLILFFIVTIVAQLAAKAVFGSVFRIAFGNADAVNAATVLTALVVALVSTAATVVLVVFATELYLAVCDRDEVVPATA